MDGQGSIPGKDNIFLFYAQRPDGLLICEPPDGDIFLEICSDKE
jgi:hypothetical protein